MAMDHGMCCTTTPRTVLLVLLLFVCFVVVQSLLHLNMYKISFNSSLIKFSHEQTINTEALKDQIKAISLRCVIDETIEKLSTVLTLIFPSLEYHSHQTSPSHHFNLWW